MLEMRTHMSIKTPRHPLPPFTRETAIEKVRLAEGLDDNDRLSKEAIDRGIAALQECKESMLGFEADTVRIVATYTLRKAINRHEFISEARKIVPYPVEVICGFEETVLYPLKNFEG